MAMTAHTRAGGGGGDPHGCVAGVQGGGRRSDDGGREGVERSYHIWLLVAGIGRQGKEDLERKRRGGEREASDVLRSSSTVASLALGRSTTDPLLRSSRLE